MIEGEVEDVYHLEVFLYEDDFFGEKFYPLGHHMLSQDHQNLVLEFSTNYHVPNGG